MAGSLRSLADKGPANSRKNPENGRDIGARKAAFVQVMAIDHGGPP